MVLLKSTFWVTVFFAFHLWWKNLDYCIVYINLLMSTGIVARFNESLSIRRMHGRTIAWKSYRVLPLKVPKFIFHLLASSSTVCFHLNGTCFSSFFCRWNAMTVKQMVWNASSLQQKKKHHSNGARSNGIFFHSLSISLSFIVFDLKSKEK